MDVINVWFLAVGAAEVLHVTFVDDHVKVLPHTLSAHATLAHVQRANLQQTSQEVARVIDALLGRQRQSC